MHHVRLLCFFSFATLLAAQTTPAPPPQSARQALIEMFMGKDPDDFAKHLPDAARQSLIHKGETPETSMALRISTLGRDLAVQGGQIETFDVGPNILVSDDPRTHQRIEVAVEHDSLLGEEDEIELSVHVYDNGQVKTLPVIPRLIFTLKTEKDVWRLTEVTVAGHIPLTDPDYLKELRKQQNEADEAAAQGRMSMIVQAETTYAAGHPQSGYVCSLDKLFPAPTQSGEPGTFYAPNFANEESNGYRFALSGCDGSPASKYRLLATPIESDSEIKTFCSDQSGAMKFLVGGKASTCFSSGQAMNTVSVSFGSVE